MQFDSGSPVSLLREDPDSDADAVFDQAQHGHGLASGTSHKAIRAFLYWDIKFRGRIRRTQKNLLSGWSSLMNIIGSVSVSFSWQFRNKQDGNRFVA